MPIKQLPWPALSRWARPHLGFWRSSYAIHSIMGLLLLLIALFAIGMFLLSHLNLNYSQQAMYELRRDQIRDVFFTGLVRIDAHQTALERQVATLATIGETFYRLSREQQGSRTAQRQLQSQLEKTLQSFLESELGVSGAGLWYQPGIVAPAGKRYAPYLVKAGVGDPRMQSQSTDFKQTRWFELTLGREGARSPASGETAYWSPVYFDMATGRVVLTLAQPVVSAEGVLIGVATIDWASDQVVDLVSRMEVTQSSFAFLNDRNNRNLSSLSQNEDPVQEQKIIDAILAANLSGNDPDTSSALGDSKSPEKRLRTRQLDVDGRLYELYYATTPAGMVYGAGVPKDEIDRVLVPMRDTNYRILVTTGSVLLILSLYLLYRILQLMRELQASYTDVLTGLPNRVRLLRDLQDRQEACLILLNLDRFKEVNSLFGNECGDAVLLAMRKQVRSFIRTHSHPFGPAPELYRLSSDEFALLGPGVSESRVRTFASELTEFLCAQRVNWQQQALTLDTSAGIAFLRESNGNAASDLLLNQATIAVSQARDQMRQYLFYDQSQEVEKGYEKNIYWARRLKKAIETNALRPHFQPIHDNQLGTFTKYECLVRMDDPEHGVIAAGQFMEVANKLRLNRQITRIMVEKSFAAFATQPHEFSINLSYMDIVDPETLALILEHLRAGNVGERVIFEILESDGIGNYGDVLHFIDKVKSFGCRIAIDDFGTGYSNFSHLLKLNVDFIKIDGSLIRYLAQDHTAFLVTKGIVQFARSLGIKTVAEFVHSEVVQQRVVELGIDFSQGEYFGMPAAELLAGEGQKERDK
ncbi:EAL domain-containing protein [Marinobacter sp.]|uniref:bifunctional diguanylate cyclase/phosphodiesterase n=1 Tax=Marinobacter sp. TaxID=50741 RepID=UPI0025B981C9|nr:EAL domain-containing protein [Marinobacter sp.]